MPKAADAGAKLRSLLRSDDTLHFFTSPYRRTRETTEGILNTLTCDDPDPSPFRRHTIKVYEEPRLREQDFGNFQPGSGEMARMWQERADYGHFFYRIPNGESAADAYDRISGFNESLWRSFGEEDFASVCVLVTHGLMTRVFLMKWYHFSVEYFEDLRNVNHCEFVVMKLNPDNGKFILQNQLRTWSQLQRDKEKEEVEAEEEEEAFAPPASPIPIRKRWGHMQDSCDADGFERRQLQRRQNTADLFRDESWMQSIKQAVNQASKQPTDPFSNDEEDKHHLGRDGTKSSPEDTTTQPDDPQGVSPRKRILSPALQTILDAGRDGGGSQSGVASEEEEDETCNPNSNSNSNSNSNPLSNRRSLFQSTTTTIEPQTTPNSHHQHQRSEPTENPKPGTSTSNIHPRTTKPPKSMALALQGGLYRDGRDGAADGAGSGAESGSPKRVRADALGDQSDVDDDDDGGEVMGKEKEVKEKGTRK